jgi:release factor glutamine methyltransferase
MSASVSPSSLSAIVTRLRAAGCVFAEDEAQLLISAATTAADLDGMVDRRAAGAPIEHVVGWAEFCGLRISVEPGVFVPRRRSEFLVRQAAAVARQAAAARPAAARPAAARPAAARPAAARPAAARPAAARPAASALPGAVVVDLCCGSGAVGAALIATLAGALGLVELHAVDLDPAAVRCARRNLSAAGGVVYEGDLTEPLPAALRGRVDVLVANVPYVPTRELGLLPAEARAHEPRTALDGGADGLDVLRRVAAAAPQWLARHGGVLVETSERQAPRAVEAFAACGLIPRVRRSGDLNATVVIGTSPARRS